MTFPLLPDYQLFLLPARNAVEASAWGSAAMEYAAFFPHVHFSRDPARVDWRNYNHVTIVHPQFWPDDLIVTIRQSNPNIGIDVIPAQVPAILQTILNVRVYTGLRYGPRVEHDWSRLWPAGRCLVGLHGRADGALQEADYTIITRARMEAVKLTSYGSPENVLRLRALNPEMFILARAFLVFNRNGDPIPTTPVEFYERTVNDVARLYEAGVRYIEIHNEPNLRLEGFGGSWHNGGEFGQWFLQVLELYRARFPEALFGFPGLSPGPSQTAGGRVDSDVFLAQAADAIVQADWIGVHAYWQSEAEMNDAREGYGFTRYRERFPDKLLFITEFGNPAGPKAEVAAQYARYYASLRKVPGLGAAFAYIVSTSNPEEAPRWAWRTESGQDVGIAFVVGQRRDQPDGTIQPR
jgi:hypothetical protein